eukprot:12331806-Alexandrium_andersonii.AAC.1
MCSALKDNEDKRVRWRCRLQGNTLALEGDSTKALGVMLPVPCMRVTEAYEAKLGKSIYEARRTSILPIPWKRRRQVVGGGVTSGLAWAL